MTDRKVRDSLDNLERSIQNLERALLVPSTQELAIEGTIQRFETTIELFWKTLQRALRYEGLDPKTPRESVKEAFQLGWLEDEEAWLDMLDARNRTSHQYLSDRLVERNYRSVVKATPTLRAAYDQLRKRYP
jgi:nucleotidyltransferase substrate binding protein (TIGR01987 family)